VLLVEKRQEIGSPVRCAEGVPQAPLLAFLDPDKKWIAAEVTQAEITTIIDEKKDSRSVTGGSGFVLERRVFDRVLAENAVKAGAEVVVKTTADGLLFENERVVGVKLHGAFIGAEERVEIGARVVIAADGIEGQVGRWAGLNLQLKLADTMVCAQYLLAGIQVDPSCSYYLISDEIAPGGYAWIFPKGEGVANVGLGVQADLWSGAQATQMSDGAVLQTVLGYLTRFIEIDSRLAAGFPVNLVSGNVPVCPPPDSIVSNGLMVVGDAACQVDPLTGGGIINAMKAGKLAGEVAVASIERGDTSVMSLRQYQDRWEQTEGRRVRRNYRLRMKFPPSERVDDRFVRAFALAVGG
jgi:digeranylgeranylglycerophospholipid reductase